MINPLPISQAQLPEGPPVGLWLCLTTSSKLALRDESIETRRSEEVTLLTDEGAVLTELLREDQELPHPRLELSDSKSCDDTLSLITSLPSTERNSKNWGCWLQTARNVSLLYLSGLIRF